MDDAGYISIRNALEQIKGGFPKLSMQTIEQYCEEVLPYVAQVANSCRIDPTTTTHKERLEVIIYATIREDYCEEWESRIADEHLLDMAETLQQTIEITHRPNTTNMVGKKQHDRKWKTWTTPTQYGASLMT